MLSGGGIKAISYVGALDVLERRGYLKHVREYLGTSAGAFFGMCKVIGYTQKELRELFLRFDFSMLYKPDVDNIFDYTSLFGVDDGADVRRFLESVLRIRGFPRTCTFKEFYDRTGIGFRCFAADLMTLDMREFSAVLTPDECLVTAVFASMAIPFYFKPVRDSETGHLLVDGAIINNVPLKRLSPAEQVETLVLAFHEHVEDRKEIQTVGNFLARIWGCYYIHRYRELTKEQVCYIRCADYPVWQATISDEEKLTLVECGERDMDAFIRLTIVQPPSRRWSVS